MRPNRELVLYALYLIGGDTNRVHTEDIAVKCHELFPDSFSWVRYPALADKDIVRIALADARKAKNGSLVEGRTGRRNRQRPDDGWRLTEAGLAWVMQRAGEFDAERGSASLKEHRQDLLRKLRRLREHPLFVRFRDDPPSFRPSPGELADMLRCRVDADEEIWQERFTKLRRRAESAGRRELVDFLDRCREAYVAECRGGTSR